MRRLWKVQRTDFFIMVLTAGTTIGLGVEVGVGAGVAISCVLFVRRSARARVVALGRMGSTDQFRDVARHPEAAAIDDVLVLRVLTPAFFANARAIREAIDELVLPAGDTIRAVVIDASSVAFVDATAEQMLRDVHATLEARDVELHLCRLTPSVRRMLDRSGLPVELGHSRVHRSVQGALQQLDDVA
jgi:SulP family sulfate permease